MMEPGNPPAKMSQTVATGGNLLLVEGIFAHGPQALGDLLTAVAAHIGYYMGFVWGPINPYILEGIKTISYEIAARLPGAPDVVICPVGGGDMFAAQWRGYLELQRAGVIDKLPRMIAVQSVNAPPLIEAFQHKADHVATLPYARSKISGINVPFTGDHALAAIRESGGLAVGVRDEDVLAMQERLAVGGGIRGEPAGAALCTGLRDLGPPGENQAAQRVVCVMSGAGFKDSHLAEVKASAIGQQKAIPADVDAIRQAMILTVLP